MNEMQKSYGNKKSTWKIPLLMLMLSDIKVPLSTDRSCVFQLFHIMF